MSKMEDVWPEIVRRAWTDEVFAAELSANPAEVLIRHGVSVPEGLNLKLVCDDQHVQHLVLPRNPLDLRVEAFDRQPLSDANPGF